MTVTLIGLLRRASSARIRVAESGGVVLAYHQVPSSREDVPMPHNRRGLLFAMVAALALLVAGARTAWAQDAVVRGTITSERGEPIPGANVVVEELRIGVVTSATGQYALNVPGAGVRAHSRRCCCAAPPRSMPRAAARTRCTSSTASSSTATCPT